MRLREIMSRNVETVGYDLPAQAAWQRMTQRRIHHLVVVRGRELVGVVSARDLGGKNGENLRRDQIVADLMTSNPVTARPDDTVRDAANLLRGRSIGCLPVLESKKLLGIVTITDLLELIGRGAERGILRSEGPAMKSGGPRRMPAKSSGARAPFLENRTRPRG